MKGYFMGVYQSAYWQSDGTGMNRRERQSGTYHPFLPDMLAGLDFGLLPETASTVSRAEQAIRTLNETTSHLTDTEPLARLILRSEAIASSRVEGLEVNARKLLEHEALEKAGAPSYIDSTEASVLRNISAMQDGVHLALRDANEHNQTLRLAGIQCIHKLLMGADCKFGGVLRNEQNWIGGNRMNPIGARYVPPQPEYVLDLMEDLVTFCNSSLYPPLVTAALVHAQFETIHPFADGNGRTGRALIHLILRSSGLAPRVTPPISLILATDKDRYLDNLSAFRTEGSDASKRSEDLNNWVEYFAHATLLACERAQAFEVAIANIQANWREIVKPRANSAADLLIQALPKSPVISKKSAAALVGRSIPAAGKAVEALAEKGVLVQNAKNKKSHLYVAKDILDAFTSYERALASPDGNTAISKPSRKVPQRQPR